MERRLIFGPQLQKDKSVLELVKAIKQNWKDINFEDISDFAMVLMNLNY